MLNNLSTLVETAIRNQSVLLPEPIDLSNGHDSILYADNGSMDSITLVTILVDIEDALRAQGVEDILLADTSDLAVGATPFATLGSLVNYVNLRVQQIAEQV